MASAEPDSAAAEQDRDVDGVETAAQGGGEGVDDTLAADLVGLDGGVEADGGDDEGGEAAGVGAPGGEQEGQRERGHGAGAGGLGQAAVGEAAGDGGCERAAGAGQREEGDAALGEAEAVGEQERDGSPRTG